MADEIPVRLRERTPRAERVGVPDALVARVRALYEAGQYLDAYDASRVAGPLRTWSGADALVLASRLAGNLGALRLGGVLIARAKRDHPRHGTVSVFWCHRLFEQRGPLVAWRAALAAEAGADDTWSAEDRSDLWTIRAHVAATYRDAETSAALVARARATSPDDAWPVVTASVVASLEDRPEVALALAREALVMRPRFRPALLQLADLLAAAGRRDEAVALLEEADPSMQCPAVPARRYELLREAGDPAHLLRILDRVEALSPVREPAIDAWLALARCHAHGRHGDHLAASREAARVGTTFHRALADRLARPEPDWRRVRLPVPFVLQAHRTCGPATLAAISSYLGRPVPQAEIVEAICYGGTWAHAERRWCEQHAFFAREFRVTWDVARRLIDAAVPFAVETRFVDSGHLQPVVGYDAARRTLLLQEPGGVETLEVDAAEFLAAQRLTGPRGLAFVPSGERDRLASADLPDAALYDLRHEAEAALERFDRAAAERALASLEAAAPGHPLGWLGRLALASFDDDAVEAQRVAEALLALFPDDPRVVSQRLGTLRVAGRRDDRIALLERAVEAGVEAPSFRRELALERMADARTWPEARRLLLSAHRLAPRDARTLALLADLEERSGAADPGLDVRRFATSLEDTDEGLAADFSRAAIAAGRPDDALGWLRRRFAAHGAKASAPAITLADALTRLSRTTEALEVLREAVRLRPADGALRVHLAQAEARAGAFAPAREQLEAARATTRPGTWSRADAALRRRAGDLTGALAAWRQVLAREPLALDAHREVAWLLAALERPAAAVAHLAAAAERFPHHVGLAALLLGWVRDADPARAEAIVRHVLDVEPSDAWWRRELAIVLYRTGRLDEAVAVATAARDVAPQDPASHGVLAKLELVAGRLDLAREGCRAALRLDADYAWAIDRLIDASPGDGVKREALEFVRNELLRQATVGDGVRAYATAARSVVPADVLRRQLTELRDSRPDVWEAWSEVTRHTADDGDVEGARRAAERALERFPMRAGAWQDLARVRRQAGDVAGAAEAARRAVHLAPELASAWLDLARHVHDGGDVAGAISTLREAMRHDPLETRLATALASLLRLTGDVDGAWRLCAQAVVDEPRCSDAWSHLDALAAAHGRRDELAALGRRVTRERPGDPDAWVALAGALPVAATEERLEAFARAAALAPHRADVYDQRAYLLARQGRFDEARAVLASGPWPEGARPVELEGRDAWILAEEGHVREAIARLLPVVERVGDYVWGWSRLAAWAEQVGDTGVWERATAALCRLAPTDPDVLAGAADVELHLGRHSRGVELLRRALTHDPGAGYAGFRLLALAWEDRDRVALDGLAARVRRDASTEGLVRAAVALSAALAGDVAGAEAATGDVMRAPDVGGSLAEFVETAFRKDLRDAWGGRYERWLDEVVLDGTVNAAFARRFAGRQAHRKDFAVAARFDDWLPRMGERAHPALLDFLDGVAEHRAAAKVVPALIRRHADRLRADVQVWGKVGYAFAASDMDQACVEWLEGGAGRADAEAWMLFNLASGLRGLGRDREAEAVSLSVVRRGLRDATWDRHVALAAYGEALAGRHDEARHVLAAATPKDGDAPPDRFDVLREAARALCDVGERVGTPAARVQLRDARRRLRALATRVPDPTPRDERSYAAAMTAMARQAGRRWPSFRSRWPRAIRTGPWVWYLVVGGLVLLQVLRALERLSRHAR